MKTSLQTFFNQHHEFLLDQDQYPVDGSRHISSLSIEELREIFCVLTPEQIRLFLNLCKDDLFMAIYPEATVFEGLNWEQSEAILECWQDWAFENQHFANRMLRCLLNLAEFYFNVRDFRELVMRSLFTTLPLTNLKLHEFHHLMHCKNLTTEEKNDVILRLDRQLLQMIPDVERFIMVISRLNQANKKKLFSIHIAPICDQIKTANDAWKLLSSVFLSDNQKSDVFERIKTHLSSLIKSMGDLNLLLQVIPVHCQAQALAHMADAIPRLEIIGRKQRFFGRFDALTKAQFDFIFASIPSFPNTIKDFEGFYQLMTCQHISSSQKASLFRGMKDHLMPWIKHCYLDTQLQEVLSAKQREAVLNTTIRGQSIDALERYIYRIDELKKQPNGVKTGFTMLRARQGQNRELNYLFAHSLRDHLLEAGEDIVKIQNLLTQKSIEKLRQHLCKQYHNENGFKPGAIHSAQLNQIIRQLRNDCADALQEDVQQSLAVGAF